MDTFPNTALSLSLSSPAAPPGKDDLRHQNHIQPPLHMNASTAFSSSPLLHFLSPSLSTSAVLSRHADNSDGVVSARVSPAVPVQLELLPLKPSPQKPSSSSPSLHWQPPSFSGIDMNHMPACASSREEISENNFLMKRERERSSDAEQERNCEVSSRGSDDDGEGGTSARKKLRLSKEQSSLLEESFKEHSTLNPKQKAELAKQLNLRPRQVEVWFQNRRARTKLKQTEVDCELLKRCCESLTEENRRLQKEVQELRAIKVAPPCIISSDRFMPLPAATLSICPSCERVASRVAPPASVPSANTVAVPTTLTAIPCPSSASSSTLSFATLTSAASQQPRHLLPLSFPPTQGAPQHALPSAAC
ncbi:hypothetical protein KP509_37G014200 [Ceratopteris richardii]|uniref:Homeobox domain-containing protein n=1 Tax=Ceratopteris richardii TaxID=49495 RepID=A0A8T2Q6X1_CERRI|nr:hypothetical protein KP509_37G014200 [Ceratopteris richardii]